jgi:hypothetical protein
MEEGSLGDQGSKDLTHAQKLLKLNEALSLFEPDEVNQAVHAGLVATYVEQHINDLTL